MVIPSPTLKFFGKFEKFSQNFDNLKKKRLGNFAKLFLTNLPLAKKNRPMPHSTPARKSTVPYKLYFETGHSFKAALRQYLIIF